MQLKGQVTDQNGVALQLAGVKELLSNRGTVTDSLGNFVLNLPEYAAYQIQISYVGYYSQEIRLNQAQVDQILNVKLQANEETLSVVEVKGENEADREQSGVTRIKPVEITYLPGVDNEISDVLSLLPGVSRINEFSASYAVRGGNFDENLVYVNEIPIYRPFLTRTGRQEGLSFVNPRLVEEIKFSAGGWQPRWGDKLSSVLDIQYKNPDSSGFSVTAGLLGANLHVEAKKNRLSLLAGGRYKNTGSLLGTTEIDGEYRPRSADFQALIGYDINSQHKLEILNSININRYNLIPTNRESTFGTFQEQLRLSIFFEGLEAVDNNLFQQALKYTYKPTDKLKSSVVVNHFYTLEYERSEVEAAYLLSRVLRDNDGGQTEEEEVDERLEAIGAGTNYVHIRNRLQARVVELLNRNHWNWRRNQNLELGVRIGKEIVDDKLQEYQFIDSAGFIRYIPDRQVFNDLTLDQWRYQAYIQNNSEWLGGRHLLTYGARFHYSTLNNEALISPRVQYAYRPVSLRNTVYTFAVGLYQQPPFYREFRDRSGVINPEVQAQKSLQLLAGGDWNFTLWDRLFNLASEVYYKRLYDVNAYDQENVRIRYFADNNAQGYVYGGDMRLSGELIPGAESWLSFGALVAREDIAGDAKGYLPRPTDQRINLGIFVQDHIPNDPSLRAYLKLLYGSGLPFSPPNNAEQRAALRGPSYARVDLGLSKIISPNSAWIESFWIGLEVLNLLANQNVINYTYIQDFGGAQYAVPNTLSSRFLNLKFVLISKKKAAKTSGLN